MERRPPDLSVYQEIDGVESDKPLTIGVGPAKVALKGETATDEMDGFVFRLAKNSTVKPVLAVLRGAGPALVKIGKNEITPPDEGRANAIAKFAKTCKLD